MGCGGEVVDHFGVCCLIVDRAGRDDGAEYRRDDCGCRSDDGAQQA